MRQTAAAALFFVFAFGLSAQSPGADPLHQMSRSFEALVSRVSPAVVEIFVTGYGPAANKEDDPTAPIGRESSLGSGVIVEPNGYIITNYHVIRGARRVSVLITRSASRGSQIAEALQPAPQSLPAKIVGANKSADLAVLKVDAKDLPTVPFARYSDLHQGQLVFAIGSPEGLQNSVSMGLVSSVMRQIDPDSPMVFIQTDAAINPGNSGGALVDVNGNLVGINSSILSESGGNEGLGFAIPSGIVRFVYEQIRRYGRVRRGDMGADVQTIDPALATALHIPTQGGVIVSDVLPQSPADAAGLKVYDVIQTINGIPVPSESSFVMNMYLLKIGDRARVGILRGKEKLTLEIPVVEVNQGIQSLTDLADPEKNAVPQLGILGIDFTSEIARLLPEPRIASGVLVAGTITGHRAAEIGLEAGDMIHSVNAAAIDNLSALRTALSRLNSGDPVVLQIEHSGRLMFRTFEME
ncbi:MAG TPA: trypsin-like peptidase domain-containing protein [Bryobacteraceae bacterium]|nr:trypsin-like peptidase domain-containing protein [Bryobacteraceae bacterium]